MEPTLIRIFIGTDRSQYLAARVLKHSLEKYTSSKIIIENLDTIEIPEPKDIRQSQRTGFSFARWAIPEICLYQGRAIYLDADMLVFTDIQHLWNMEMDNAVISIVDGRNATYCSSGVKLNKNESSVMLLNCGKASWNLKDLVKGLDGQYNYKEMMTDLCFLNETEIKRNIPRSWNSMDYWDSSVDLIHYTNVPTQPWVSIDNPYGYIWVNYLKEMIHEGSITIDEIEKEIKLGYIRPSLAVELTGKTVTPESENSYIKQLKSVDANKSYVPHREVMAWNEKRLKAIKEYERNLSYSDGVIEGVLYDVSLGINSFLNILKKLFSKIKPNFSKF